MPKTKNRNNKSRMRNRRKRSTQRKMEKMNCNPGVKNNVAGTCYTNNVLMRIRDSYNKSHDDKITSSESKQIVDELRERLDVQEKIVG